MKRVFLNSPLDPRKTDGLVAFYSPIHQNAGGELVDLSGNGRNGIFYNSPTWENNAICGNGIDQYIDTQINQSSIKYPFTIFAKICVDTWTNGRVLLAWTSAGSRWSWATAAFGLNIGRSDYLQGIDISYLPTGKVKNICVVYQSASSLQAYVDGTNVTRSGDDYWVHSVNMWIGGRNTSLFSDFRLEQLAIYNRALMPDEIKAHQDPDYLFSQRKIYGFAPASGGGSGMFHFLRNSMGRGCM